MRWRNREQSQVFDRERQTPAPVRILMRGGQPVDETLVFAAYDAANAGTAHGPETTLEELIGKDPPQGGEPPW